MTKDPFGQWISQMIDFGLDTFMAILIWIAFIGFGSTDCLSYDVLCELHLLGILLNHKIEGWS